MKLDEIIAEFQASMYDLYPIGYQVKHNLLPGGHGTISGYSGTSILVRVGPGPDDVYRFAPRQLPPAPNAPVSTTDDKQKPKDDQDEFKIEIPSRIPHFDM